MGLGDRLRNERVGDVNDPGGTGVSLAASSVAVSTYRQHIHRRLIDEVGPALGDPRASEPSLRRLVTVTLDRVLADERLPLSETEHQALREAVHNDVFGFGPLDPLLADDTVTEVMCNGPDAVWVERAGRLERTETSFVDDGHLHRVIDKMVGAVGRRIDEMTPVCDARLASGARVHAVLAPVAVGGPFLTIRKFGRYQLTARDLVASASLDERAARFLACVVEGRRNIVVAGGAGSGKTTLLNVLSSFIPAGERIITVEDAKELQLRQEHVLSLESRPANVEGRGAVTIRDLVRNSLRMRPDRIVVGEVRSGEALDMLQAMNTGHSGSLTTVHANSPRDALARIETLVLMSGYDLPLRAIRQQIASSLDLVVYLARQPDGSRRVTHITEVQGMEGDVVVTADLFAAGMGGGPIAPTGIRPRFEGDLAAIGVDLPADLFVDSAGR